MSDPFAPPPGSGEEKLELDLPKPSAPAAPPPQPSPPPRPSAPARSAARAQPLPEPKKKINKDMLREGAADVFLNAFSILREVAEDFRSSDRFFKYKALVLSTWFMLVATSVGVSCSGESVGNSFGARVIISGETAAERAYMVKNDSDDEWQAVQITVNDKYFVTAAQLRPYGDISLSPRLMFDAAGKEAPANLVFHDIHVTCSEGDAFVLKGGQPQ